MGPDDVLGPVDPAIVAVELDGSLSLYHPATQVVLTLNDTASVIWEAVRTNPGGSVADVVLAVAARYDVTPASIEAEVIAALDSFAAAGFLDAS